jgi:nucleotide-binding universal stress UspA family protein
MGEAFKKILLAFDNSDSSKAALQSAYGVSLKFNSEITALVVTGGKDNYFADSVDYLKQFNKDNNLNIDIVDRSGLVHDEIIKLEKEGDFSLILQGSHGGGGWKEKWMGSNAFKVVSSSNCPVISVTENASSQELKHILLPLADSRNTRQKVPYCIEIAKAFGSTVHILGISKNDSAETKKHIRAYVNQTEKYLLERGIPCTTAEKYDVKVVETCIQYAEDQNAGLMLMMTETESAGWLMDSYSQQLVNLSTVPVMTIHSRDTRVSGAAGY